jgi:hypothetical protein
MHNNRWWGKHNQNTKYAEILLNNQEQDVLFNKPMLLVTVTTDAVSTSNDCRALFGVFLCTTRMEESQQRKFRISLLWRKEAKSLNDASKTFGKIMYATELCARWREYVNDNYRYLGPNCARLGTKVMSLTKY